MKSAELPIEAKYYKVGIPFTPKEEARFRAYLKANDKKAGAFARTAILAAMGREEGPAAQSTEKPESARTPEKFETAAGVKVPGRPA